MSLITVLVIWTMALGGKAFAQEAVANSPQELTISGKDIVDRGLELLRGVQSSHAVVSMTLWRPTFKRELEVESYHQGRDKSFLLVRRPAKEKGTRTLRLGHDIWTYKPDLEQSVKIPFSMMHTSWMGSDFTYEDMVKLDSFVTEYTHRIISKVADPEKRGEWLVTIELVPIEGAPVVWGKVIWSAVVSGNGKEVIPIGEQDYSERDELIREIALDKIETHDGRRVPMRMTCLPKKKEGSKTVIDYLEIKFDEQFDNKMFTKESLDKGLKR
ncbi:MAG: outer membrane lipoprotein-sorting protein [Elusimicrobiota bacterium]